MSLSRSKPLEPDRSHDWEDVNGGRIVTVYECRRCGEQIRHTSDEPPDWQNCPGMKRGGSLDRSTPLKPVANEPKREHQRDQEYRRYVRHQPCAACGDPPPSDPAHVKSRGAGYGDWIETDDGEVGNLLPLCRECHRLQHDRGIDTFEQATGTNLADAARQTGDAYRQ